MPFAERPPYRLYYEAVGDGSEPTVLVHGIGADHSYWAAARARLAGAITVLAYDRPGSGASEGPPPYDRPPDDARALVELLTAADLFPAHIVGSGYGGIVGLRLAVDRAELVRSVAVHDPPAPPAGAPSDAELARIDLPVLVTTGERVPPSVIASARRLAAQLPNRVERTLLGAGPRAPIEEVDAYAGELLGFILERNVPTA